MSDRPSTVAPNILNTVDLLHRLPLMRRVEDAQLFAYGLGAHLVRVPSDGGGRLRIGLRHPKSGDELSVIGPDGTVYDGGPRREVRVELEALKRGSGLFVAGVRAPRKRYEIYATFEEVGAAKTASGKYLIPWNFWYFPYAADLKEKSAWGSSVVRPLHKYEEAFGVSGVVDWELDNHRKLTGGKSWEGHCNIAALASIAFEPPPPEGVEHNGVRFECEEIKLLAAEVLGRYADLDDVWTPLTFSPRADAPVLRTKKPDEDPGLFGSDQMLITFLEHLSREIRMQGYALAMDLRDATGKDPEEVWNHAVFYYATRYWQPDAEDPTLVEGEVELLANADTWDDGKALGMPASVAASSEDAIFDHRDTERAIRKCRFRVRFTPGGKLARGSADNQWLSVIAIVRDEHGSDVPTKTFAPVYSVRVKQLSTAVQSEEHANPFVDRAEVLRLIRLRSEFSP